MSDTQKFLDTFPSWLGSLGADAEHLAGLLAPEVAVESQEVAAAGLNYLFKSLDLIPDGIHDIGYLDDAFVLRVAADLALRTNVEAAGEETLDTIQRLSSDCDVIREFLNDDYDRLERYVRGLRQGAARGRSVEAILGKEDVRGEFITDVRGFSQGYECPSFNRDEKNLTKLRAFLDAKLPRTPTSLYPE
ncbi:MAG: DUF1232 domain-containing protein [Myxococcales bacterium]|nr:DUF1232 domain-containing protein [Myxococcales bacterium]